VTLKEYEPRIATHTQRVLARRQQLATKGAAADSADKPATPAQKGAAVPEMASAAAPRPGARPQARKSGGGKAGGGKSVRPGAPKRR
jgi:preprotein translocase subunit SecF